MSSTVRHPPLASDWIDAPHCRLELGDFALESGQVIREAHLSYVVHGDPRNLPERAVLITTSIGGNHHRLDFLIGRGNAIDPDEYCIIAADALGNGLSSSPSNAHSSQRDASFPRFTIRDMVASQRVLVDTLGVRRMHAVIGASMGGMQALQWGVSHPDRMGGLVAMTPLARASRWSQLMNELSRRALFSDESCQVPRARASGLDLWVPLTQLIMSRTPASVEQLFVEGQIVEWLRERAVKIREDESMDPFDWCYQTWAYDAHDVGTTVGFHGDTAAALRAIGASTLVIAPALDLYNPAEQARWLSDHIPRSELVELPGHDGHSGAAGATEPPTTVLRNRVREFLSSLDG